ncbi:TonB-dependent receptor [Luteimonas aquatica]|uniref:TonB-dependent receptor n=1 Tax=Luteimonas aquatica TaxID=450364 RepID=UPI001F570BE5|nr:TonB-dependent receptor [Luteimonas aquatica]
MFKSSRQRPTAIPSASAKHAFIGRAVIERASIERASIERASIRHDLLAAALACACASFALPVAAQEQAEPASAPAQAQPAAEAATLDTVQVTGNRRVQSIQKYAGTIQSFTGTQLDKLGVNTDIRNLSAVVPALQITKQEGKYEMYLRGIGASDSDFSSDPAVATYYNGIYLPRPRSIGPMFFDVERVEVNKGPQGTVRGRNAAAGSINVIPNQPELGAFNGNVKMGLGNYDFRQYEAVVNVPLTETLATRIALFNEKRDSYIENGYPYDYEGPGAFDNTAVRASFLWQPTDQFSAYVMLDKVKEKGTGDPGMFTERALAAGYDIKDLDDPFRQYFRRPGYTSNDIEGAAGTFTYRFSDAVSVEFNTSYRAYDFYNKNASREWQLGPVYPGSDADAYHAPNRLPWYDTFYQADKSSSRVNELRFFGDTGRLIWSAGLFNYGEKYDFVSWDVGNGYWGDCDWYRPGTICGWQNGLGGENRGDGSEVESNAIYADLSFAATDKLRLIGGIRYTRDKKTSKDTNAQYQFVVPEELFADFGVVPSDLVIGSPGFRLKAPGDRSFGAPSVCSNSGCTPGPNSVDYFLDGVASWGANDTWDDFLRAYRDQIEVRITSDFPEGRNKDVYKNSFVDWRAGVEYDITDDTMFYATVSTGTRSGGLNKSLFLDDGTKLSTTFKPEKLTSYEVGLKSDMNWGEVPVRMNAALFYYDYKDKVLQNMIDVPNPNGGNPNATKRLVYNDNAANAELLGLELEGKFGFAHGIDLGYNFTYLDAKFKDSTILDTRSFLFVPIDGNRLPFTSKYNVNLSLSQVVDVEWGGIRSFDWTVNLAYRSKYYLTAYNSQGWAAGPNGPVRVPLEQMAFSNNRDAFGGPEFLSGNAMRDDVDGFTTVNVSAGLNFGQEESMRVDAFVSNLTDEVYSGKGFINNSVNIRYLNTPRMYGVRFSAKF